MDTLLAGHLVQGRAKSPPLLSKGHTDIQLLQAYNHSSTHLERKLKYFLPVLEMLNLKDRTDSCLYSFLPPSTSSSSLGSSHHPATYSIHFLRDFSLMATCQIALSHRNYKNLEEEGKCGLEISLQVLCLHSQCVRKRPHPLCFQCRAEA